MLDDLKKELSSFKVLSTLLTIAVSVYLLQAAFHVINTFSDVILILVFGWLLASLLEPLVHKISSAIKIPLVISTLVVFILIGLIITIFFVIFIPLVSTQLNSLLKIIPSYIGDAPPFIQKGIKTAFDSVDNYVYIIPSVAQFLFNLITILILSFYLIIDKKNIGKTFYHLIPKDWRGHAKFIQSVIDHTFASFIRVQIIFGVIWGVVTYIVLFIFGVDFAASSSLLAGLFTVVPMIGPIIGLIPPLLVSFISEPSRFLLILVILIIIQQVIFNIYGPKIMGNAFKMNPAAVLLSLLIGLKVGGLIGGVFAVPIMSIVVIIGRELQKNYENREDKGEISG